MPTTHDTTASTDDVWAVLADGWAYSTWVVGTSRIRAVDPEWPKEGSKIHHSVGLWPFLLNDDSLSLGCHPGRELRLSASAFPLGRAEITLRLHPLNRGCRIEIIEHAVSPPLNVIPRKAQHVAVHPRNVESLRRLAFLAERSTDA
ncbi:MAG: SRPBCC family protein [Aldersonia sp.]|nr:SRPBCC family protein [Aldersonia sp.]